MCSTGLRLGQGVCLPPSTPSQQKHGLFLACLAVVVPNAFFAYNERKGLTSKHMTYARFKLRVATERIAYLRNERGLGVRSRSLGSASSPQSSETANETRRDKAAKSPSVGSYMEWQCEVWVVVWLSANIARVDANVLYTFRPSQSSIIFYLVKQQGCLFTES
jgi:hypothetical protein